MRILIASYGSSGDVYPLVSLGKALIKREHEVCLACPSIFEKIVTQAGLSWMPIFENNEVAPVKDLMEAYSHLDDPLRLLKAMHQLTLPAFDETISALEERMPETDCFISSYLFANLNAVAQRHKIPTISIAFAHNIVPLASEPPDQVPALRWLPPTVRTAWARLTWAAGDHYVTSRLNRILKKAHKRNQLARWPSFFRSGAHRMLVAVSPSLFGQNDFDRDHFAFTGFLQPPSEIAGSLDAELITFLDGEKLPLLTFGSISPRGGLKAMQHFINTWPKHEKLLVQAGWVELDEIETPENVHIVGPVPHHLLLPHVSVAAHHGGAGTSASFLRHGIPALIIPHIADQRFWAKELRRIKAAEVLNDKQWEIALAPRLIALRDNQQFCLGAAQAAEMLRSENGPETAADHIEAICAYHGNIDA